MTARVLCLLAVAFAGAQSVRDLRQESKGAGEIAGAVVTEDASPRPLRLAAVQLSGDALLSSRTFVTDADGKFSFQGLPAGQYTIQVRRSGYMPKNYGAKRADGPGVSVVLTAGQRATDLNIPLTKWASINGTVYDQNGEPAENVSVEALAYSMRTGVRMLSSVYGSAPATDDRGVYHYGGLAPGDYYLAVGPSRALGGIAALDTNEVDRVLQRLASGAPPGASPAPAVPTLVTYAPVFFAGTTDLAGATKIALAAGEERSGVDVHLQLVPTATLSGTVTLPDGQPAPNIQVAATLIDVPSSIDLFRVGDLTGVRTDAQGRFRFTGAAPGRYEVTAQRARVGASGQPLDLVWAKTTIAINGTDQEVSLSLQPGLTLSGRLVFDGTSLQRPADTSAIRVQVAVPAYAWTMGALGATVSRDGAFSIAGMAPGRLRLAATVPGSTATSGWLPRSAIVNGVDAFDAPVDITQSVDNVVITFTDHPAELAGAVQTPPGAAASDYFVIVFSTDRAQWGPQSRRTVMARPTTAGQYRLVNLPPGEYFVAAVTDVMQNEWFDPAFLDQLVPAAIRITIGESEKKTQDIRIRK